MISGMTRHRWLATSGVLTVAPWALPPAFADAAWDATLKAAHGPTVYFNAWAGSERINAYLQWAATELMQTYGAKLEHVKRIRAERAAGKTSSRPA